MSQKPTDYLTETHKIRKALWKRNFEYYIGLSIALLIFSYAVFDMNVSTLFLTKEEHELINKYQQLSQQAYQKKDYESGRYYNNKKNEIVKKTPYFITIYHVFLKWKQKDTTIRKILFTLLYIFWYLFIGIFAHLIIKYYLNKMKPIIYQIPKKEEVMPLSDKKVITLTEMFNNDKIAQEIFNDPVKVEKIVNTSIAFHDMFSTLKPKFKQYVDNITKTYSNYISIFYPELNQEAKTIPIFNFLMWHYVINFYGNLPTGVLSIYIKNNDFKIILSAYQRKIIPVIYTKKRKSPYSKDYIIEYQKDKFYSYFFLRSFYELDKMINIYENIEDTFSPLPFQSPIKFQ